MKKLFITALFALLMGGFTVTSYAQPGKVHTPSKSDKDKTEIESKINEQAAQAANYVETLKSYKEVVDQCVREDENMQAQSKTAKNRLLGTNGLLKQAARYHDTLKTANDNNELNAQQKSVFKLTTESIEPLFDKYKIEYKK